MRKLSQSRRVMAAALAATFIGATAVWAATPSAAAPVAPQGGTPGSAPVNARSADTSQTQIPAPPKPPRAVPIERVVATAGTGAKAVPTRISLRDQIKTAMARALGATTAAAVTTNPTTRTSSGLGAPGANPNTKTLVLYDNTGPYGWLGEDYGIAATNLVSHFGAWTAHPVGRYTNGELANYTAVVYVGSTYDEPLPLAFLDDVLTTSKPVVWMYDNIWQLTARQADFSSKYGFTWMGFDFAAVSSVTYKGTTLTRDPQNGSGIMNYVVTDPTKVTEIGRATRADGTPFPWGVRSGNLTYIGEIPFAYITANDRYLAFSDYLFEVLAPQTAQRHRALVRIEDVGPDAEPSELRAVTDYLYSKRVPFTVAVYSRYRDPNGVYNGGVAEDYTLKQRPQVISALKYMESKGGTLLMHGYTHQLNALNNPYDGVSGNDFEFYLAHVDDQNFVRYDGPVNGDSATFVNNRVSAAAKDWSAAGLKAPTIFEPPHYAASAVDYKTLDSLFGIRYDRGLYFPGVISGATVDHSKLMGQFFPYTVRDVYGSAVVPENIGNIEPEAYNHHPIVLPADLIAHAKTNLVVRDGVASFFYHPYLGVGYLKQTVEGVQGLGYNFVSANAMLA